MLARALYAREKEKERDSIVEPVASPMCFSRARKYTSRRRRLGKSATGIRQVGWLVVKVRERKMREE